MFFTWPEHVHPMVVHFPIALFITALVFDLLSLIFKKPDWHRTAVQIYIFAALLTPLVLRTGIEEAQRVRINHPLLDQHSRYAHWAMWTSLASLPVLYLLSAWSKKYFRIAFLIFCLIVVSLITLTADRGGKLVYEYGVGIEE